MHNPKRARLLRLAAVAAENDIDLMQGRVTRTADGWRIGSHDLGAWLAEREGEEIVLTLGSLEEGAGDFRPNLPPYSTHQTRTCRKCGRDFTEAECPHCRRNRERIRGRYS